MILRVVSMESDGTAHLAAEGPLTLRTFRGAGGNPLAALLGNGWSRRAILLDLKKVDYFDSFALGWLLNVNRELSSNGGLLLLHSASRKVIEFLKLLKLETILSVYESESSARGTFVRNAA